MWSGPGNKAVYPGVPITPTLWSLPYKPAQSHLLRTIFLPVSGVARLKEMREKSSSH